MPNENLIVPVYLNQRILFDMVAMLQGGISTVSKVKKSEDSTHVVDEKAKASFGLSDAFSMLLKISLSGEHASKNSEGTKTEHSDERVHTPASLFFTLRGLLIAQGHLKQVTKASLPQSGDIVEIALTLSRNPVLESIEMLGPLMNIAKAFEPEPQKTDKKSLIKPTNYGQFEKQMAALISDLRSGGTVDLVGRSAEASLNVVVTAETDYLRDPMMSDIVDGQYRVVGKVIRSGDDAAEPLSLLRKSTFARLPQVTNNFLTVLAGLGSQHNIAVPEIITSIEGPLIQVIPIAIYA